MEATTSPVTTWHRPARIDIAIARWREKRARNAGCRATVIPYAGYGSTEWIRVLGRVILSREPERLLRHEPVGTRGWRNFTSVGVQNAEATVEIDGVSQQVQSDHSGFIDAVVPAQLSPGWHTVGLSAEGSEPTMAKIMIVDPDQDFGIVSDVDDTVMVTALPRPLLAAWHTFVVNEHARATTPGMPVLYERLAKAHGEAPVIYLSTGSWNVAPALTRFLSRNLYPPGVLLLTDWGPTADRWFRSGREHKRGALERLAGEFPKISWLLVGDDGQHDEAIYTDFVERQPDKVRCVCIRRLTPSEAVLAGANLRAHPSATKTGVPWLYASDGAGFAEELERVGVLAADVQHQPEVST
jgi:phosphatidate phosphatase APP1